MKKLKSKDFNKYLTILVRVVSIVFCVYFFLNIVFIDTYSAMSYLSQKNNLNRTKASNDRIAEQNRQLEIEIERLRTDPLYIESIARRNFTMVKEGETVFIFRK